MPELVRVGARRRRRWQQAGAALCVVVPGHGAHQLAVQLGDSVRFQAAGPCSAHVALVSHRKNLVGRASSFPSAGDLVADAAKVGVEVAQVTVTDCPSFGGADACTDPTVVIVVGVITVQITSGPTP